ncbi:DUF6925 family protein [Methylobacterium pseudosasicola]|uniref:Uncharacterized protein n=1 Tax=Methylobacterium pseudosasicola TaxID=582667 RepID=A0A1I4LCG9_9HYPH|nr:hypothetical protein [Methylobacterium pseudosasicola]SFL88327.1 hypothetical protein SAMN05192568_101336 [Methylobacterium pseudosasicola]
MTGGSVVSLLRDYLADPACAWSLGAYGAVAAFSRDPAEPVAFRENGEIGLSTPCGAIMLAATPELVPFAYETGFTGGWSQAVALCLPDAACAMGRRDVLTELGPDAAAARTQDRGAILFDLGLGLRAVDACVRVADPGLIDDLRAAAGRPILAPGNPIGPLLVAASPHRVFLARFGRIEVYTPIPPEGGVGAPGPHSHILPKLLRLGRTHAATAPIPPGLVPCAALHPAHPAKDVSGRRAGFDAARHAAFGRLLDAWGDPALTALRRMVLAGGEPDPTLANGRFARSAIRAARAQVLAMRD